MAAKALAALEATSAQSTVAELRRRVTVEGLTLLLVAALAACGAMVFVSGYGWKIFAMVVAANGFAYGVTRLAGLMVERRYIRLSRERLYADALDLDRAISNRLAGRG